MVVDQGRGHIDRRFRFDGWCRFVDGRTRGGSLPLAALI
jgi:hypothetical protein